MAENPDIDPQDLAEVYDEDNLLPDGDRLAGGDDGLTFDSMTDVYDATSAVGDEDDDEALIGEDLDDEDIIALETQDDMDDDDLEDDDLRDRDAQALAGEDDEDDDFDDDEESDLDADVARLGPDEVQLEDAGDLNNREHAMGSAKRFESARLSDEDLSRLRYGEADTSGAPAPAERSFDPAGERTPAEQDRHDRQDELLDQGVEETFPASDPVSVKHIT